MSLRSVSAAVGCALMFAATASAHSAAPVAQTIVVGTDDTFGVPEDVLVAAEEAASHLYAAIGVALVWVDSKVTPGAGPGAPDLLVRFGSFDIIEAREVEAEAIGAAPRNATQYRTAYVFYDRVLDLTRPARKDPADVLGFVIAHELGHLLLPVGSHAPAGLMRGHWMLKELEPTRTFLLQFSTDEASLIRQRAHTLAQPREQASESRATTP